jgi:hypothetical protein
VQLTEDQVRLSGDAVLLKKHDSNFYISLAVHNTPSFTPIQNCKIIFMSYDILQFYGGDKKTILN